MFTSVSLALQLSVVFCLLVTSLAILPSLVQTELLNGVGASVAVVVDNAVATDSVPSSLVLQTTSVGQTLPVQRLQVQSDGTIA